MSTDQSTSTTENSNNTYSNIDLREGNYTGSYFISETNRFQSVYSSQNYGVFYELYTKANFHKEEKIDVIKSFEFIIVNYKGPLNLGFADLDIKKDELFHNKEDQVLGLRIVLSGKNNKNYLKIEVPESWGVTKKNIKQLNVFRMLVPLNGLKLKNAMEGNIFDTEFYERNGIYITRKKIVPSGNYDFDDENNFGPAIEKIATPDFANNILNLNNKEGDISILAKDSNCYTSSMFVK